ncbi:Methyltransferase type 12 [Pseudopedobacter saltans DSM 12145]|uniref:Methyltransferase type 12 n=2 Tax=Pseudopedobacter saltans TaxID=151895 RepID=F0SD27_PSESL|nr:Methyltransferase type 12 [Pseudopedobacter saltans DSM 12145]
MPQNINDSYYMDDENIVSFYDEFVEKQRKTAINERIFRLYKRMLKLGLKSGSNVLELGCGIGAMTFLLSKTIKDGKIEAIDISGRSVAFSRDRIKNANVVFYEHDVVNYMSYIKDIDFITLFDVIEHIPIEKHNELFYNISLSCNNKTKILINIPNPECVEYDIKNNPEALQIIDQPVPLQFILKNLENNGLTLSYFETYSIWAENDYQFFVVKKKTDFNEILLKKNLFKRIIDKLNTVLIKIKYNYN